MRKNNKGLSLVELLVAFSLLAIVAAIMLGFVISGGNLYRSVNSEIILQVNAQVAMAQLKEYIIDCNGGICYDGDTIYVVNHTVVSDEDIYTAHMFTLDSESVMQYSQSEIDASGVAPTLEDPTPTLHLLTEDISELDVHASAAEVTTISSLDLVADFEYRGKSHSSTQTIALRNKPYFGTDIDELLKKVVPTD